jgi:hypothetical protein
MADVCDDDGVSGESLRRKGAAKLLFFFYPPVWIKMHCHRYYSYIDSTTTSQSIPPPPDTSSQNRFPSK